MANTNNLPLYQVRADCDRTSIVVYQAYRAEIADAAVRAQRFVAPFSLSRMTWIKPSFLWMMGRCGWARKPGQERVLAVRITRAGWEKALSQAVLTSYESGVYADRADWERQIKHATVNVQWDPERTLSGAVLDARSIQVGLSRHIVAEYVEDWTTEIRDITPTVRKMAELIKEGRKDRAAEHLPKERPYEVPVEIARRLGM
ncbi:DUF4291 domain-containing protein [Catenulispora sp. NL8]|uniref:DUF4291 domain-containing protein n=1 Tax=Catenulispora pinistramenti TaxID=2705254 RepID=A0ABS5KV24_9ACTN|nr:DUF4291 domain-containing protein [Catenulispora pinistramenti]MBS2549890.1 DUF4291 domain-containing protein [Catenulispora pinistramenti]